MKKLYINKLIGKGLCLALWICLIIIHVICLYNLRVHQFYNWLILSILTFAIIIVVVDPIIYFILACLVLSDLNQTKLRLGFGSEYKGLFKKLFIMLLIGDSKMRDLRRAINN